MVTPVFDLWTIFLATILDTIIDLIVFWKFHIGGITFAFTLLLNFLIPYLIFLGYFQSLSLEQQIPAAGDFIASMIVNLVNFTVSAVFGYIINTFIFIFSGRRTPEPEF